MEKNKDRLGLIYLLIDVFITLVFILGFIFIGKNNIINLYISNSNWNVTFVPYIIIFITFLICFYKIFIDYINDNNFTQICYLIFAFSFTIRTILCLKNIYIPTNDFKNYFEYGINLYYGNTTAVAQVIQSYKIPSMGGLAVLNKIIMEVFSPSLLGMQVSNCIMSSFSCILLMNILKYINVKVATLAGFLYSIYPSGIFCTIITTNVHGANMFCLLSILILVKLINNSFANKYEKYLYGIIAGFCLFIAKLFHGSLAQVYIIGIFVFILFAQLQYIIKSKLIMKDAWIFVIILLISNNMFYSIGINNLYNEGIIYNKDSKPLYTTLIIGLNKESRGYYGEIPIKQLDEIMKLDEKERLSKTLEITKNNLINTSETIKLFKDKFLGLWFDLDNYFYFGTQGKIETLQNQNKGDINSGDINVIQNLSNTFSITDLVFINCMYVFMMVALIFRKRNNFLLIENIFVIITFGWIIIFLLTEIQSRYRYYAMPFIISLASIGIYNTILFIKKEFNNKIFNNVWREKHD